MATQNHVLDITTPNVTSPLEVINSNIKIQMVDEFWRAPSTAFFNQKTVARIRNVSEKTLESDRWRGVGIPFRKVGGKVLYRKSDVVAFLESHDLVKSTSQYKEGVNA